MHIRVDDLELYFLESMSAQPAACLWLLSTLTALYFPLEAGARLLGPPITSQCG